MATDQMKRKASGESVDGKAEKKAKSADEPRLVPLDQWRPPEGTINGSPLTIDTKQPVLPVPPETKQEEEARVGNSQGPYRQWSFKDTFERGFWEKYNLQSLMRYRGFAWLLGENKQPAEPLAGVYGG